jgi:hypothetical protein
MASIEHLTTEIEKLSSIERQEMAKKLLEKMNNDEIMQLLGESWRRPCRPDAGSRPMTMDGNLAG